MSWTIQRCTILAALFAAGFCAASGIAAQAQTDPLPSWNEGAAKKAITDFVARVTTQGSPDFVPVPERIATFDNDGTLWCEQPIYFQLAFAFDRVKAWRRNIRNGRRRSRSGRLEGDVKALAAAGEKGLLTVMAATHTGMTVADFTQSGRLDEDRAASALQAAL